VRDGDDLHVFLDGRHRVLTLLDPIAHADDSDFGSGTLAAPMPGKVIAVHAAKGARVARGAPLVVMEAMKMEHTLLAPADGVVAEVCCAVGEQMAEGAQLIALAE
jgi:3-methylcrotonyl-CoA carboxylase alpha subunit